MTIPFLKMQGAANDFVVVDHRVAFLPETDARLEPLVRRLCDRRRGVGADGVLLLERGPGPGSNLDFAMRYFNADGRPAEFCGNGARCLARLALDLGLGTGGEVRFQTAVGVQRARRGNGGRGIELHFGEVDGCGPVETVEALGRGFTGRRALTGVPHFVVPVERVEWVPVKEWGSALRHHPAFGPSGTNVDFIARLAPGRVAMRTYERGVEDETLACGSGAMASALWAVAEGDAPPIAIVTAGGDELEVGLTPPATPGVEPSVGPAGARWDVRLTGPAEVVYRGEWTEAAPAASAVAAGA
jgi:diaminopimelate epimerase